MNRPKRPGRRLAVRRSPGTADAPVGPAPSLRDRDRILWDGWLVRVRIVEDATGRPIGGVRSS